MKGILFLWNEILQFSEDSEFQIEQNYNQVKK